MKKRFQSSDGENLYSVCTPRVKSIIDSLAYIQRQRKNKHSHKKRKNNLETRAVLLIFLKYLGWPYRANIKTAKNCGSYEELLSENDFDALAGFCCYDYGANASEAVQKIVPDQKDYHKCSSFVIVC